MFLTIITYFLKSKTYILFAILSIQGGHLFKILIDGVRRNIAALIHICVSLLSLISKWISNFLMTFTYIKCL